MISHASESPRKSSCVKTEATPDSPCETVVSQVGEQESDDSHALAISFFSKKQSRLIWAVVLGVAGLFDILGTVLPRHLNPETYTDTSNIPYLQELLLFTAWLDSHHVAMSFAFSGLWFVDAFWKAHRTKRKVRAKIERDSFMLNDEKPTKWWKSSSFAYYRSITIQLLCLPVGFYVAVYYMFCHILRAEEIEDLDKVDETLVVAETDADGTAHYETFSVRSKKAFVFALLHHFGGTTTQAAMKMMKSKLVMVVKSWSKKLFGRAIRNPLKFRRQLSLLLIWIRYIKYGFPLFGKVNRIKGLVSLSLKRQRQRMEAMRAKRARQMIWDRQPPEALEKHAAIKIQSAFRARQSRKALKAMKVFRANEEYIAISKIQHVLRRKLRQRRAHLQMKKDELRRLEQLEKEKLSDKERLRLYELRDELMEKAKELLNRQMLIRPNTRFSAYWKLFFAICLFLEMANFAVKPWLQSNKKQSSDLPSTMEELIAETFVPTRVSDLPQCHQSAPREDRSVLQFFSKTKKKEEDHPWYCHEPFSTVQEAGRDFLALALIPAPVSEWPECQQAQHKSLPFFKRQHGPPPTAWYCDYDGVHNVYRTVVDFFWNEFDILIGVAYFWDVFVTFFTGEFHPQSGVLMPKPFFPRWIVPGLILQLLVNPYLKTVSTWTFQTLRKILDYGPVRVYRWNATVVFPLVYWMLQFFVANVWVKLVEFENQNDLIPDGLLT